MRKKWILVTLMLCAVAAVVFGLAGEPHEFLSGDCVLCHVDAEDNPMEMKLTITMACESCHMNVQETQSHPTDLFPSMPIPDDMLLVDGIFTCVTCHYVHPKKKKEYLKDRFFLRRQVRGPLYCSICHEIDENGHIPIDHVHKGMYTVEDNTRGLDRMSVECIECHDDHFKEGLDFLGAGTWEHSSRNAHPVGISYGNARMNKSDKFRNENSLKSEIRFFNGNIGCGTCHNMYSGRSYMLVMDNTGSQLCLECHIK